MLLLTQPQDKMLFLQDLGLSCRLDGAREKNGLEIAIAERLERLVPAEQISVELRKGQLVIQVQTRLEIFFR
jgi:hypothetical protein